MSQSLIAFDTDHIKGYVFGTNKLKEIRGASSILDRLNREDTEALAEKEAREKGYKARRIYANGGSALFLIESKEADADTRAEELGKAVQKLYREQTGGGASITYAIQSIPDYDPDKNIMTVKDLHGGVTMKQVLNLLHLRLRLAKDSLQQLDIPVALPSHALLCTCESCGVAYAQDIWRDFFDPEDRDPDDPDDREEQDENRYCRVCIAKRNEDRDVKNKLREARENPLPEKSLWGRILKELGNDYLHFPSRLPKRPKDFNVFRNFTHGKEYMGLIYADGNGMGNVFANLESLEEVEKTADRIDKAVYAAMAKAIKTHLPVQRNKFPFDILMIGGDDIVIVTPADKAMQVAYTLAEEFHKETKKYTLSVGVVLAPVKYPFSLQRELVDDTIKAAKKSGAQQQTMHTGEKSKGSEGNKGGEGSEEQEQSRISFVVVTGNTSLNYQHQYEEMHSKEVGSKYEFFATMRPYTLSDLRWLLDTLQAGKNERLGRTKLHQLREAILKLNQTSTILESLALFRNWKTGERDFVKQMVRKFDNRQTQQQRDMGLLFPWSLDGEQSGKDLIIYRTPLLDFIDLYDFVS